MRNSNFLNSNFQHVCECIYVFVYVQMCVWVYVCVKGEFFVKVYDSLAGRGDVEPLSLRETSGALSH